VTGVPRGAEQALVAVAALGVAVLEGVGAEDPRRPVEGPALLFRSRLVVPAVQAAAWDSGGLPAGAVAAEVAPAGKGAAAAALTGARVTRVSVLHNLLPVVASAQRRTDLALMS
jgi:hypothetical protein